MNFRRRLKKLESLRPSAVCFCSSGWWVHASGGGQVVTCSSCKEQAELWHRLAEDAVNSENLTDAHDVDFLLCDNPPDDFELGEVQPLTDSLD